MPLYKRIKIVPDSFRTHTSNNNNQNFIGLYYRNKDMENIDVSKIKGMVLEVVIDIEKEGEKREEKKQDNGS